MLARKLAKALTGELAGELAAEREGAQASALTGRQPLNYFISNLRVWIKL